MCVICGYEVDLNPRGNIFPVFIITFEAGLYASAVGAIIEVSTSQNVAQCADKPVRSRAPQP